MNNKLMADIKFLLYCLIVIFNNITLSLLNLMNYPDFILNNIIVSSFKCGQVLSVISLFCIILIITKSAKCRFNYTKFEKYVLCIFVLIHIVIYSSYFYACLH